MKKIALVLAMILICVLLTGCGSIVNQMGDRFVEIESDGNIALCYCRDTMAVYIIYDGPYRFGMSPYIMFDELNQAPVGKWNGKEIVPAELEVNKTYMIMGKGR